MSTRLSYPGGGGYFTWNGITWKMHKEWKVTDEPKFAARTSNTLGHLPPTLSDLMSKVGFSPKAFGTSIAAQIAALFPFTNPATQLGTMAFPLTDLPVVGQTQDGKSLTYPSGQITKMPPLTFAPDKPLFGDAEITMLLAGASAAGATASHETIATSAYTEPAMTETDELYDVYALTLGGTAIETDKDGIVVTPGVELEWIKPAMKTTQQARIKGITCEIEFTPLLMDVDTFYSTYFPMQGTNVGLGKSASAAGTALVISGSATGKLKCTVPNAAPVSPRGPQFDNSKSRIDKVKLTSVLSYASSAWQPLFTLALVP